MTAKNTPSAKAMAFYNADGLPAAWRQAAKYAGHDGHIATLPDIIATRLATGIDDYPWSAFLTTSTAEYFGKDKDGKYILIIAHGVGPMATLDGIQKAYSWHYLDEGRNNRRGGRITEQEFRDLEAGKYGEVEIVDYEAYCTLYEYPLCGVLRASEALKDPILKARFGARTEEYVKAHAEHARRWHREQAGFDPENRCQWPNHEEYLAQRRQSHQQQGAEGSDPYILTVRGANNCPYGSQRFGYREIEERYAVAHLLSIEPLCNLGHQNGDSLVGGVGAHEWYDGVRFVSFSAECDVAHGIHKGPDPEKLLRRHWRELLVSMPEKEEIGFRALVQVGDEWFTQYPKKGNGMDTCEPEYHVTAQEKVGVPVQFRTPIGGHHILFKYGISEVRAIAPAGANAYEILDEIEIERNGGDPTHHTCLVQFYRITADTTKRLIRADRLRHDYNMMMLLMEKEAA